MRADAIVAKHRGRCELGDDLIFPGDVIVPHGSAWVHERCAEEEAEVDEVLTHLRDGTHLNQGALPIDVDEEAEAA